MQSELQSNWQVRVLSGHRQGILDLATTVLPSGAVRVLTASDDRTGRIFAL